MRIVIILITYYFVVQMKPDQPETDVDTMPIMTPTSPRSPSESAQRTHAPSTLQTDALFQGNQEILINHNGENYRLRITKNGKLILTK